MPGYDHLFNTTPAGTITDYDSGKGGRSTLGINEGGSEYDVPSWYFDPVIEGSTNDYNKWTGMHHGALQPAGGTVGIETAVPYVEQAGLKDWMKDKAWPWIKETGEGMKNQIPYFLDNTIPFYEPPEGYYDPDWEENKDMAGLEENDLYHLMRNGYTLEEAQEILNEQIGDGSFEMAEALTPEASFKILQGLADKSPEYFYKTLPMIYGDDLWDETPMFNYGGDFYGNSELSWG